MLSNGGPDTSIGEDIYGRSPVAPPAEDDSDLEIPRVPDLDGPKPEPVVHYVCVARETVILTRYKPDKRLAQLAPDFKSHVDNVLQRLDSAKAARNNFAYPSQDPEAHPLLLHVQVVDGLTFLALVDASVSLSLVNQFLSQLSTAFRASFGTAQDVAEIKANKLPSSYRRKVLKPRTDGINLDPRVREGTLSKAVQLQKKVEDVTVVMLDNLRDVQVRERNLEDLQASSEQLSESTSLLYSDAVDARRAIGRSLCRTTMLCWICGICAVVSVVGVIVAYIAYGAACNDWTLQNGCKGGPKNPFTNFTIPIVNTQPTFNPPVFN